MKWIDKTERLPERGVDGADHQGCVLAWHIYQGCCVVIADRVCDNSYFSHWMRLPDRPQNVSGNVELPPWKK